MCADEGKEAAREELEEQLGGNLSLLEQEELADGDPVRLGPIK